MEVKVKGAAGAGARLAPSPMAWGRAGVQVGWSGSSLGAGKEGPCGGVVTTRSPGPPLPGPHPWRPQAASMFRSDLQHRCPHWKDRGHWAAHLRVGAENVRSLAHSRSRWAVHTHGVCPLAAGEVSGEEAPAFWRTSPEIEGPGPPVGGAQKAGGSEGQPPPSSHRGNAFIKY